MLDRHHHEALASLVSDDWGDVDLVLCPSVKLGEERLCDFAGKETWWRGSRRCCCPWKRRVNEGAGDGLPSEESQVRVGCGAVVCVEGVIGCDVNDDEEGLRTLCAGLLIDLQRVSCEQCRCAACNPLPAQELLIRITPVNNTECTCGRQMWIVGLLGRLDASGPWLA